MYLPHYFHFLQESKAIFPLISHLINAFFSILSLLFLMFNNMYTSWLF
ncbi:hypothetical protein BOVAC16_3240 [Bacteroides ovatus]|nr:hypothetical protein BOVAC16_3240 [Bacteroides ovatus]